MLKVNPFATAANRASNHFIPMLRPLVIAAIVSSLAASAQDRRALAPPPASATPSGPQRIHLILRDGTFQLVLGYKVRGEVVTYRSAERNGEPEDIPLSLVDLPATERWVREHTPGLTAEQKRSVLTPELAREEAERAARTPEIAPDLRLPEEDSVLVLDTFRDTPELVPLPQQGTDLNRETAHETLKQAINPASAQHRISDIPGDRADVQLHVPDPVFFVRIGDDSHEVTSGGAITVDTHGQSGRPTPGGGSDRSTYVIERIGVRGAQRQIDSFHIADLGTGAIHRDVIELKHEDLPGGHWLKLTPVEPLLFGEYALIEIVSDHEVNLDVWDFGVHADAKENTEAQRPQPRTRPELRTR